MLQFHFLSIVFISLFFGILFLQSGLDKLIDWPGNLEFHTRHFKHSLLKKMATGMLVIVTIMEICCGILATAGLVVYLISGNSVYTYFATCLASLNFCCLFFGQRIAKDYAGAAALVPYFILSLMGMYLASA